MQSFCTALLDHPILLVILLMFFMGFVGMTYEFILRLCGKSQFLPNLPKNNEDGNSEPLEPTNVPKPPVPPSDTLMDAEEIPDGIEEIENEDGTTTVEYTYAPHDSNGWEKELWPEYEFENNHNWERTH